MNKFAALLALLCVAALPARAEDAPPAAAAKSAYQAKSPKLDRAAVDALLATPDKVLFVDVRRPDELTAKGSFPVYLSIQAAELEKSLAYIPRDRRIVTVSNHAARALKAADLLAAHGFQVAGAVGVENYAAEGGTIVKLAPPPAPTASAASAAASAVPGAAATH